MAIMKRAKHSLSHYKLCSMDLGVLTPLAAYEVLPGDTIQQSTSALVRVAPLLAPVMHPVWIRLHHWFVPYRLLWDEWEPFITGGPDGNDESEMPVIQFDGVLESGTLADYLGIPPGDYTSNPIDVCAFKFRAYNLIFNEFYRDEDLVSEVDLSTDSGLDTTTNTTLLRAAWQKDYFTSARPWEQKGDGVTIPIGSGTAPLSTTGDGIPTFNPTSGTYESNLQFTSTQAVNFDQSGGGYAGDDAEWADPKLEVDLSALTGIDVNDLRLGLAVQRYREARARYGSRYVEYLRYLGVTPSDARLQRPEYLGGGRQTLSFSEILATAETTGVNVGDLKGHGIAAMRSNRYRRFIEEHGVVLTLASVLPKAIYSDSLHRSFLRRTKEDYWQKELQHIGQQPISNAEIYSQHSDPSGVFGYQDRYDEYRRHPSTVAGEFRNVLNYWHYARQFDSDIALNEDFVSAVPTNRVYASTDTDPLYVMAQHSIQARRMVAKRGTSFIF